MPSCLGGFSAAEVDQKLQDTRSKIAVLEADLKQSKASLETAKTENAALKQQLQKDQKLGSTPPAQPTQPTQPNDKRKNLFLETVKILREELKSEATKTVDTFKGVDSNALAKGTAKQADIQQLKTVLSSAVQQIAGEFEAIEQKKEAIPNFAEDGAFADALTSVIEAKRRCAEKVRYVTYELEHKGAFVGDAAMKQILATSLDHFGGEWTDYMHRTGVPDFPWRGVAGSTTAHIHLSNWSPAGLTGPQLAALRAAVTERLPQLRSATVSGRDVTFAAGGGLLSDGEAVLDGQGVKGVAPTVGFLLSLNSGLTSLSLKNTGLDSDGYKSILDYCSGCTGLTALNGHKWPPALLRGGAVEAKVEGKAVSDDTSTLLAGLLLFNAPTVSSVSISSENLSANGVSEILSTAVKLSSLKSLSLGSCQLGEGGATAIADKLGALTNLESLDLGNNKLKSGGITALGGAFNKLVKLQSLNLRQNNLEQEGGKALAAALVGMTALQILRLMDNGLGVDGGPAVARAVSKCPALSQLFLSRNALGPAGGASAAAALKACPRLETLSLMGNGLTGSGCIAAAQELAAAAALRTVYMDDNGADYPAQQEVRRLLPHVTRLDL